MTFPFRKTLLSATVSLAALLAGNAALAQEAVIVLNTNEVGAPTYNPIKASMLNTATGLGLGSVKTHVRRGLAALRPVLGDEEVTR